MNQARPTSQQNFSAQQGTETKLYDAICSNCGKATKVIFPPEPGRAIYCKACLKKLKAEQEAKKQESVKKQETQKNPGMFGPAVNSTKIVNEEVHTKTENAKIENVSFNQHRNQKIDSHPHRKEINLSDLKKALEDSLSKRDKPDDELKNKIEEEKEMDEVIDKPDVQQNVQEKIIALPSGKKENTKNGSKKSINPGEKVKL